MTGPRRLGDDLPELLSGGRHALPECRAIAEPNTILRCQVGSGVHGTAVAGLDDRDEMGICCEPPEYVIGLATIAGHPFSQWIYRTQPEGAPSGPGDLDYTCYSLRKWMRLALAGNPTVLLPLFVPSEEIVVDTSLGESLRRCAERIISRQAGARFAGYLEAQRRGLLSRDGKGRDVTRAGLVAAHGWDTKYGGHMIRLGLQGVELMRTGRITLPLPEPGLSLVRAIRAGEVAMNQALERAQDLEAKLMGLLATSDLPPEPDYAWADRWLIAAYATWWDRTGHGPGS